jgi:hypothetical protein
MVSDDLNCVARRLFPPAANDSLAGTGFNGWKFSMRKMPVLCSFLMAFGLSAVMIGCDPASKAPMSSATKARVTPAGPGSTTGGGVEVPTPPAKGAAETPKAEAKPADGAAK